MGSSTAKVRTKSPGRRRRRQILRATLLAGFPTGDLRIVFPALPSLRKVNSRQRSCSSLVNPQSCDVNFRNRHWERRPVFSGGSILTNFAQLPMILVAEPLECRQESPQSCSALLTASTDHVSGTYPMTYCRGSCHGCGTRVRRVILILNQ